MMSSRNQPAFVAAFCEHASGADPSFLGGDFGAYGQKGQGARSSRSNPDTQLWSHPPSVVDPAQIAQSLICLNVAEGHVSAKRCRSVSHKRSAKPDVLLTMHQVSIRFC